MNSLEIAAKRRKERNQALVNKVKNGEYIPPIKPQDTWWPDRPQVKKDKEAMRRLYGKFEGDK